MSICRNTQNETRKILKINDNKEYKEDKNKKGKNIISNAFKNINKVKKFFKKDKKNLLGQEKGYKIHCIQYINHIVNKAKYLLNIKFAKIEFLNLILFLIKLLFLLSKCSQDNLFFKLSEVNLKIKGPGLTRILSKDFFKKYSPSEIYINNILEDNITYEYNFNSSEIVDIKLKWNHTITKANSMFKDCISIIELDLTNFSTSQITDMSKMFYNCSSLKILDLSNFDTSQVTNLDHMFWNCAKLVSIDLSKFNTCNVKNMGNMFSRCNALISLNLSNFDTSLITDMSLMFFSCKKLEELILTNFDTSKVTDMHKMFYECSSLTSLNLSNFNTSKVTNMNNMFYNCNSLTSLDLSNFDTSKVIFMNAMFNKCKKLASLNLSNFDTSQVKNMSYIFSECSHMSSLDISSFNTSNVIDMRNIFSKCSSIISLNLSNFDSSSVNKIDNMFYLCTSLNSIDLSNFNISNINNLLNIFSGCENLEYKNLNLSFLNSADKKDDDIFILTHPNLIICGKKSNEFSIGLNKLIKKDVYCNNNTSIQNNYTCFIKDISLYDNSICYKCGENFFIDINNFINNNNNPLIYCNYEDLINISCYHTCESCDFKGNKSHHYCIECKKDYLDEIDITNSKYKNCYKNNTFGIVNNTDINTYYSSLDLINGKYQNDSNNSYYLNFSNNLIDLNTSSVLNNSNELSYLYNSSNSNYSSDINYLYDTNDLNYSIKLTNLYDVNDLNYSNELSYLYSSNNLNFSNDSNYLYYSRYIDNSSDLIYSNDSNYLYNSADSNNSYKLNFSFKPIIDPIIFNSKEIKDRIEIIQNIIDDLINEFNMTELNSGTDKKIIDENKIIILTSTENQKNNEDKNNITMDLGQCENILKKEYNISNNTSLYILQIISEEEGMKIPKVEYEVHYPLSGNNLTKLNLTLCKDTKIELSIKVKIKDSLDKYNLKSDYYNDICSTTTSESGTDISLKDRKNEFINNNMSLCEENCDLIEYNPIKEKVKCSCDIKLSVSENYDIKFNKQDFLKSFIDIKNMFNLNIIKCYKTVLKIKRLMKNYGFFIVGPIIIIYFINLLIFTIYSYDKIKKEVANIVFALKTYSNPVKKNLILKIKNKNKNKNDYKKKYLKNSITNSQDKTIKCALKNKTNEKSKHYRSQVTQNISKNLIINKKNKFIVLKYKMNININHILQKKDFELNSLNYIDAIKLDHRGYCKYYISLFKYNHPILFSFVPFDDYNSQVIKIFLFFFSFCLDFAINALFFNDDTMHKIYKDKGKFDLLYQIPQILYSTLISKIIDTFIRSFALSQNNIIELKQIKEKKILKKIHYKLLRTLKIKFVLFFLSSIIILIFFGYYIICFCGVYINTQIHLIKDSIMSLIISLLIPFVLYLIPGIFRIPALRAIKSNRVILYNVSQFIENLFC